ncbi:hypothetical protein [Candidatus Poriferisodalis sp.]|uniref:hypothetical protein n=1 Tax=Candidatus Poriferisodalis sp. TaxID=3101277 RepID=UPI003B014EFE
MATALHVPSSSAMNTSKPTATKQKTTTFSLRETDRDQYLARRDADRKAHQADLTVLAKRISRLTFWLPFEVLGALAAVVAVTEWLRG